jgi:hypothetical protein
MKSKNEIDRTQTPSMVLRRRKDGSVTTLWALAEGEYINYLDAFRASGPVIAVHVKANMGYLLKFAVNDQNLWDSIEEMCCPAGDDKMERVDGERAEPPAYNVAGSS